MIKLEKTEVLGWEHAIRGMRNPMNSWERSDSDYGCEEGKCDDCDNTGDFFDLLGCEYRNYVVGTNDHDLMMRLANGGPVHAKYRRMITVYLDITAPLYWWKEFDTYKVGTVANSCSTMHKIAAKEFTLEDFSHEHLLGAAENNLYRTIRCLNYYRDMYLHGGYMYEEDGTRNAFGPKNKDIWWQMIQLLPSSYNQKRTIELNYEVLAGIYPSRKDHRLDEWRDFCKWIEGLPYSEIITGG